MNESAVTKVARDLSEITRLYEQLLVQAIHQAAARIDGTSLPGGEAMVSLAVVASPKDNARQVQAIEEWHMTTCQRLDHTRCWTGSEDEDDAEPILQTLLFWSEQWRAERGFPLAGRRPTVATEANVIRGLLDWAWETLPEWDDFAGDIASAKVRLENLVHAGMRPAFRGAVCMYDGATLVRYTRPTSRNGHRVFVLSDWSCPKCRRTWDEDAYARNLHAAGESLHYRNIDGETWWSVDRAAERIGRPRATVDVWVHRGQVTAVCSTPDRRVFVHLPDVLARHALAVERAERIRVARAVKAERIGA